jgi:hypothetical protein
MFHFCSHGSRDVGEGSEPSLEGAYAMRPGLSRRNEVYAALRLPQAAGPRHAGLYARAELPAFTARVAPHVSGLWKSEGDGGFEPPSNAQVGSG